MKKKSILATILVSTLLLSGTTAVSAATYENELKATSKGHVKFIDQGPEILDPKDPEIPVDPSEPEDPSEPKDPGTVPPTNPNRGDLVLQYVPELDFGIHKLTGKSMTANAKLVKVKDKDTVDEEEREVVPFVSTWDSRYERHGWSLTVHRKDFVSVEDPNKKLRGADVIFSQLNYADKDINFRPEVTSNDKGIVIGDTPKELAKASGEKQGMGSFSLALGSDSFEQTDVQENDDDEKKSYKVTNGVTFKLAERAAVSAEQYQSTFIWNLQPRLD